MDDFGNTVMNNEEIDRCAPERLAELMDAGLGSRERYEPDELAGLLRHQLNVPVSFDLGGLSEQEADTLSTQCHADGLVLKSLHDLFGHPHPPIELLEITKRYAKACRQDLDSPIPEEIAVVLYFASVAAALVRCHQRITNLDDTSLTQGIERVLALPWLDSALRNLLEQTLTGLKNQEIDP